MENITQWPGIDPLHGGNCVLDHTIYAQTKLCHFFRTANEAIIRVIRFTIHFPKQLDRSLDKTASPALYTSQQCNDALIGSQKRL